MAKINNDLKNFCIIYEMMFQIALRKEKEMLDIKAKVNIKDYSTIVDLLHPWTSQRRELKNMWYAKKLGLDDTLVESYFNSSRDNFVIDIENLSSEEIVKIRQKLNIVDIVEETFKLLLIENQKREVNLQPLASDWEAIFLENAGNCNEEELKRLWIHLLKNEITGEKTSKKTLHIMKYLNKEDALLMQKVLKYTLSFRMIETKGTRLIDHGVVKAGLFPPHGSRLERGYPFKIDYDDVGRLINLGIIESRETSKLKLSANQEYFAIASNKLFKLSANKETELPYITWSREGGDFLNLNNLMCEDSEVENYYYHQVPRVEGLNIEIALEIQN